MIEYLLLFLFVFVIALAGYNVKALSNSGAIAAFGVGIAVYAGFDIYGLIILAAFFASSSLWSMYKKKEKKKVDEKLEKSSARDWQQVLANGGTAGLFSILYFLNPQLTFLIGFLVAIASANADTWASEIGVLSKERPIFIKTLRRVDRGTSGAVSLLGSFAACLGSGVIALLSQYMFQLSINITILIFIMGWIGNCLDTIIGAFWQINYCCPVCQLETEKTIHCNEKTLKVKGVSFINNDFVNFISSFMAAWIGIGLYLFLL